ncbi:MAG: SurA N-terminal domain-containing protein [Candidatus Aureabacteria bacterium]|nr:SurA N-terminal domain-containing protein [Candidatus Auribacterota bacterium]
MFNYLQKKMKLIFIFILILIAPAFLLFGVTSYVMNKKQQKVVGKVYGKDIYSIDFRMNLRAVQMLLFLRYPQQFETLLKFYDIEKLVWNRILLSNTAQKYGITASETEIQEYIKSFRIFQDREGHFDSRRYRDLVGSRLGVRPQEFEAIMEQNYINEKLINTVVGSSTVYETDLKEYFRESNEEIKIQYFPFRYSEFSEEVKITDKALEDYFEKNKKLFTVPEKVKVRYVIFKYEDMKQKVKVSVEEIASYYEKNKEFYVVKQEKSEDGSKEEEAEESLKKDEVKQYKPIDEVRQEIENILIGEKNKKLASDICRKMFYKAIDDHSLEKAAKSEKKEVLITNYFSKNEVLSDIGVSPNFEMTKDFYDEVFQIAKGEITSPIETTKGMILAEKIDRKEEHIPVKLEEIHSEIKELYKRKRSSELAENKAKEVLDKINKEIDEIGFQTVLKDLDIASEETDYFRKVDSYVKGIGVSRNFMKTAFSLKTGVFSPVVNIPGGVIIFRVIAKKKADLSKYDEQKKDLKERLKSLKSDRVIQEWMSFVEKRSGLEKYSLEEVTDKDKE